MRRVNYDKVYEFVYELIIFMQLLYPNKMNISKIHVMVNDKYYELFFPLGTLNYENKYVEASVKDDILVFLEKCYNSIPYRNSKAEIRNIPYIVLNTSRGLEDNFLMFYRFIECYYKQQPIKDIKTTFIKYSIENNYKKVNQIEENIIENIVYEIISLRNHYVHEGYYIKDKKLYIAFPKVNGKDLPMYQAVLVHKGDSMNFAGMTSGSRVYIAVAGGLDIPVQMGSKSTNLKLKVGGYQGRRDWFCRSEDDPSKYEKEKSDAGGLLPD